MKETRRSGSSRHGLVRWLVRSVTCGAVALLMGPVALADEPVFNIPKQALSDAIIAFSRQSDVVVTAPFGLLQGKESVAITGRMSPEQALKKMLEGSGLQIVPGKNGALVLVKGTPPQNPTQPATTPASPAAVSRSDEQREWLEEIVVTATKRAEKLKDVAGGVSAVNSDFLDTISAQRMSDYAPFIPGLALESLGTPGRQIISIRGLTTGSHQNDAATSTYIDDVPIGASNSYTNASKLTPDLDPEDLQRIEVLKGPQGTLYGAASLGGVIKYVTRAPDLHEFTAGSSAEVYDVEGGSVGTRITGRLNLPIGEVLAIRLSGFQRNDAGWVDDIGNPRKVAQDVNQGSAAGGRIAVLYKPTDALSIDISALLNHVKADGYDGVDVNHKTLAPIYGGLDVSRRTSEPNSVRDTLYAATINYDFGLATLTSATGLTRIFATQTTDLSPFFPQAHGLPATDITPFGVTTTTHKVSEELRLVSRQSDSFEWLIGGFYTDENNNAGMLAHGFNPDGTPVPAPQYLLTDSAFVSSYREYAAFANATWYALPGLDITAGVRYGENHQNLHQRQRGLDGNPSDPYTYVNVVTEPYSDSDVTYNSAVRWHVTPDMLVYGRVATGYRPGGPRVFPPGASTAGYALDFQADTDIQYELGTRGAWWGNRITADLSIYDIEWNQLHSNITVGPYSVQGNVGRASSKGAEFVTTVRPTDGLTLLASLNYDQAKLLVNNPAFGARAGDPLPFVPRFTAATRADYAFAVDQRWTGAVGAEYRYKDDIYTDFSQISRRLHLPSYGLVNIDARLTDEHYSLTFYVQNLANRLAWASEVYWYTNATNPLLVPVQPRTFGLRLSTKF
jgi:iron complex outermembrane recepter protein